MFKKLKEKLADEVKANPRLQGTLDSVNQLAVQTYSNFTKEGSGSRDSLTSLSSQLSNVPNESNGFGNGGGSSQSDLLSISSPAAPATSVTSSSGQFFSLGEDDDPISLSNSNSPLKTPTPTSQGNLFIMWDLDLERRWVEKNVLKSLQYSRLLEKTFSPVR